MYLLRPARLEDLARILELARFLDSLNLPANESFLAARLARSERAFSQPGPPSHEREYQFVLVDETERAVGTCAILSKHGTPDSPHLYLRVREEERHAKSVKISMQHHTLQLQADTDGPSELGALVLHPDTRGKPGWPGKLLSWGRFVYMALHRACFEERVMAEMRATLDPEGRNAFWDAFGKRFTGMSYAEADRRSAVDKSFILELFPSTPFYATLLDEEVAMELGQVHPETRGALHLLKQAGLRWIGEIDPFDAGPFFGAALSQVIPVRETRHVRVSREAPPRDADSRIVSSEDGGEFRAVATRAALDGDQLRLSKDARKRLDASTGDEVAVTPLPASRRKGKTHG